MAKRRRHGGRKRRMSRKARAAALRNLKKARAARRRKHGGKRRHRRHGGKRRSHAHRRRHGGKRRAQYRRRRHGGRRGRRHAGKRQGRRSHGGRLSPKGIVMMRSLIAKGYSAGRAAKIVARYERMKSHRIKKYFAGPTNAEKVAAAYASTLSNPYAA